MVETHQITGSKALMKRMNRMAVLKAVRERGPMGRAEVADSTGLSRASVSYIVADLIADGWLVETDKGETTTSGGRPPILLEFNPTSAYSIVVMLGSEQVSVNICDADAKTHYSQTVPANPEAVADVMIDNVVAMIKRALSQSGVDRELVRGIAIGVPGLVDSRNAIVHLSARIPNLRGVDLGSRIQAATGLPALVENETRLIGWGEAKFGMGQNSSPFVCVNITRGIGSCVIVEDRMLFGSSYSAGQFGHMTIKEDGILCPCGNRGCWETVASNAALLERARDANPAWGEGLTVSALVGHAKGGDGQARALLREAAGHIGVGIANIINIMNPAAIVLHGEIFAAGDEIMAVIRQTVAERALKLPALSVRLMVSELGAHAGLAGGVGMIMQAVTGSEVMPRTSQFYI